MIGLLLHLVRLCPFLFGGHRQLALYRNSGTTARHPPICADGGRPELDTTFGEGQAREKGSPRLRVHWRGVAVATFRGLNFCKSGGGPNGIRTRVSALRGPCPGPLDDGAAQCAASGWGRRTRTPVTGARTRRPTARRSPRITATTHD